MTGTFDTFSSWMQRAALGETLSHLDYLVLEDRLVEVHGRRRPVLQAPGAAGRSGIEPAHSARSARRMATYGITDTAIGPMLVAGDGASASSPSSSA